MKTKNKKNKKNNNNNKNKQTNKQTKNGERKIKLAKFIVFNQCVKPFSIRSFFRLGQNFRAFFSVFLKKFI